MTAFFFSIIAVPYTYKYYQLFLNLNQSQPSSLCLHFSDGCINIFYSLWVQIRMQAKDSLFLIMIFKAEYLKVSTYEPNLANIYCVSAFCKAPCEDDEGYVPGAVSCPW